MTDSTDALMHANLIEVFNERDRSARRAAIERTYSRDVVFSDPEDLLVGHDAIDAKVQELLDGAPAFVFAPDGPVYRNHDLAYLAWRFGPEGQDPVVRGVDIAFIEGGLIRTLYTLLLE